MEAYSFLNKEISNRLKLMKWLGHTAMPSNGGRGQLKSVSCLMSGEIYDNGKLLIQDYLTAFIRGKNTRHVAKYAPKP